MTFRIVLVAYEPLVVITLSFFISACLFNAANNYGLKMLQESIFSFEISNFNSSLKFRVLMKYL